MMKIMEKEMVKIKKPQNKLKKFNIDFNINKIKIIMLPKNFWIRI